MVIFISILIGIVIGAVPVAIILSRRRQEIVEINRNNEIHNAILEEQIQDNLSKIQEEKITLEEYQSKIEEISQKLPSLMTEADKKAEDYLKLQIGFKQKESEEYQEKWNQKFLEIKKDIVTDYLNQQLELQRDCALKAQELDDLVNKVAAIVEINKRQEEERDKVNFYRLQLSPEDVEEIAKLRTVEPYLRDATPLNKVIYKVYYENPYTDLIGRVIGRNKIICGIYKITNIENGMCYVGQAKNISSRWKDHLKSAVGAAGPQTNKLYPALKALGPENFTFEVIEECAPEQLDEREKFYTDVFKAQEFGYVVKKG